MTTTINASTSSGLVNTADTSGILQLQTASTAALTIDASQNSTFAGSVKTNTLTSASATALTLQSAGTTAITVDTSQNTTFAGNTTISKAQAIHSVTSTTGTNSVYSQYTNTGGVAYIGINNSTGADFGNAAYGLQVYHSGAYPIVFSTSNAERMRIDSNGSVQVGTTSALGSARVTIKTPDNSGSLIPLTLAVGLVSDGFGGVSFRNPNGAQGGISINSTSVTYATTSDYRLKEDVQPMTGALAKVAQLKPVTYKWKINGKDSEGFIAHELAEVCPQAVTGEKDALDEEGNPKHQGIDTSFLVATLTAAIQELKAINDTQAETINALTARIVALEGK